MQLKSSFWSFLDFLIVLFKALHFFVFVFIFRHNKNFNVWKVSRYGVFSALYFPVFKLNTDILFADLCIQSKYGKKQDHRDSVIGNFSRSTLKWTIKTCRKKWCKLICYKLFKVNEIKSLDRRQWVSTKNIPEVPIS